MHTAFRSMLILLAWLAGFRLDGAAADDAPNILWQQRFGDTALGHLSDGWLDLIDRRPNRNWVVDARGQLRMVVKGRVGLAVYQGYFFDGGKAVQLRDGTLRAEFVKTEDEGVTFGVAGRVVDRDHYYLARFDGTNRLELLKVAAGGEHPLDFSQPVEGFAPRAPGVVTRQRYRYGERWTLALSMAGEHLTAIVCDAGGVEQARLEARDAQFAAGYPGLCCTPFAAARDFCVAAAQPIQVRKSRPQLERRNAILSAAAPAYRIAAPYWNHAALVTPRDQLAEQYDVVVAGAGTGGWAAALQAARLGARVLLLEETDWIGGQMGAAAVTTMDEDSVWHKFPVRERGLYREFHESITTYYHGLDKDPLVAYYGWPEQWEGGYEPKAAQAVLYGLIHDARQQGAALHVRLRSRVVAVRRDGDTVRGATIECIEGAGETDLAAHHHVACHVLIDATEYGDVIPLSGARYRVGNATSDRPDPAALVQDHTWTAVVREYPEGVPQHLQITMPPPGYAETSGRRYQKFQTHGLELWGAAGKGIKGPRSYRVFFAWRGMADADSPLVGRVSSLRHTQCGFNGGNDYPVTAATIDDPQQRRIDEREGIYRTLGALYYFQQELGLPWSLAADEGYDTPYNRAKMRSLDLRSDLLPLAVHLPQQPYVRECRRIMGVRTLVAADLARYDEAKRFPTSVAMGDYFMDLDHGRTAHAVETDLDAGEPPRGGGPFQVPLEVLLPESLDGFLAAEKNFSQSRLANGATRLQPITMLTGQAVGTLAALAARRRIPPRQVPPVEVQSVLLDSGCTLIQRWYDDVAWGTPLWRATQLLSLYQVLDRPGPIDKNNDTPLGYGAQWRPQEPLHPREARAALEQLAQWKQLPWQPPAWAEQRVSAAELAEALTALHPAWGRVASEQLTRGADAVTAGECALLLANLLRQSSP